MKTFPVFSLNKDFIEVSFGDVPIWNGVQKKPGVKKCFPLKLSTHSGPIVKLQQPQATASVINAYGTSDYMFITPPAGTNKWANSRGEALLKIAENLIDDSASPKSILEIGAGTTWIANKLQEKYNSDPYVIIDPAITESSQNIEIIKDYFPSPKIAGRRFDLILGFNVLEHVTDPVLFLSNIAKHLTENGIIMLVYPDCKTQICNGDINVLDHEHFTYFTEASSRWLASTCGLYIRSLESKEGTFGLVLCGGSGELSEKIVLNESKLLADSVESFQNLFGKRKENIVQCLDAEQTVGFHGATNGLNIFLYITGLGDNPNIFIYDGDISKKDSYLPACSSPIKHISDRDYSSHSLMVISAMSFVEQIMSFAINEAGIKKSRLLPLVGLESSI